MTNQLEELVQKADSLEKQINLVQNNVNFSIGLTWTILGVVVAIIGVALFFLIKMWFNRRFEEEVAKIDNKIKKFVLENPQVLYAKGNGTLIWTKDENGEKISEIVVNASTKVTKELILLSEFYFVIGKQKTLINDYNIETNNNTIRVTFKHPINSGFNAIQFLIMWKNPIYFNS